MKSVSILGDSISTFEGFNPDGYAVFYTPASQEANGLNGVFDTWWQQILDRMNAELCVKNSYSGSLVSGNGFPDGVSDKRLKQLRNEESDPDIILIYMGFNDYAHGVYALHDSKENVKDSIYCFEDAYDIMLEKIKGYYPDATVVCATLLRPFGKGYDTSFPEFNKGVAFEDYNRAIRRTSAKHGCLTADISSFDVPYETLDGVHPTVEGHKTFAELWTRCLAELGLL